MNNILKNSIFLAQKIKNNMLLCFYKSANQYTSPSTLKQSKNTGKCNAI